GSILVIDETGYIKFDSQSVPPRHVYRGDRDYFKVHRDSPNVGLYVSHPFMPRTTGADMSIGLSRRITKADGSFGGVVVGTLRLKYFRRLFEGM
ncbi:diguanylate cyclase, partial [Mesorhizobium sp. M1C.F.Ca.ET.176.01.1.1]